jgi:hypothetical protein
VQSQALTPLLLTPLLLTPLLLTPLLLLTPKLRLGVRGEAAEEPPPRATTSGFS